jgi:hypothetical protein
MVWNHPTHWEAHVDTRLVHPQPVSFFGVAMPDDGLVIRLSRKDRAILDAALSVMDRIADYVYPDPDAEDRIEWAAAAMHLRDAMPA